MEKHTRGLMDKLREQETAYEEKIKKLESKTGKKTSAKAAPSTPASAAAAVAMSTPSS